MRAHLYTWGAGHMTAEGEKIPVRVGSPIALPPASSGAHSLGSPSSEDACRFPATRLWSSRNCAESGGAPKWQGLMVLCCATPRPPFGAGAIPDTAASLLFLRACLLLYREDFVQPA